MKNAQDFLNFFNDQIGNGKRFAKKSDMARYLGLSDSDRAKLYKFLKGIDTQYGATIDWFIQLGGKILEPETTQSRTVHFVDVRSSMTKSDNLPVPQENYIVVPMISTVGAGPGIFRDGYEEPNEWFLVDRNQQFMATRNVDKLFAVRIADRAISMEPALHPGDTVLVDSNDKLVTKPGGIFLVMEPDGAGKIKRVNVEKVPALKVTRLTFYSDNVREYPPTVHILEHDYDDDINRAIVGRVIWAWTDLSNK